MERIATARADETESARQRLDIRNEGPSLRCGEANLLRWLRWLGRNDLMLIIHIAVIVLIGMNLGG